MCVDAGKEEGLHFRLGVAFSLPTKCLPQRQPVTLIRFSAAALLSHAASSPTNDVSLCGAVTLHREVCP